MRKLLHRVLSVALVAALFTQLMSQAQSFAAPPEQLPAPPGQVNGSTQPAAPAHRVEKPERRTVNSKTFLNPDGTYTTEFSGKAIHYRDANGRIQDVDNTLVAESGGKTIRNAANRYAVKFQQESGPDLFQLDYLGRSLTMKLQGGQPSTARWQGDHLTYPDVVPGVDLTYTAETDLVKEEIILKSAQAPANFTFHIRAAGLNFEGGAGGQRMKDPDTGATIFAIPNVYMRDAAGAVSGKVDVKSQETGEGVLLDITPDADWLGDPGRVFPVIVDPSVVIQPDTSGGMDTTITQNDGLDDMNLGFDSKLSVGNGTESLLKFDLSSLPRGAVVDSAMLKLSSLSAAPTSNTTGFPGPATAPKATVSSQPGTFAVGTVSVTFTYIPTWGSESKASPAASVSITAANQAIDVDAGEFPQGVSAVNVYVSGRFAVTSKTPTVTVYNSPGSTAATAPAGTYIDPPSKAPSLSAVAAPSGTPGFPAGRYYAWYSYTTSIGETTLYPQVAPNPTSIQLTSDGQGIKVSLGSLPTGVSGANVYVSTNASDPAPAKVGTVNASTGYAATFGNIALLGKPGPAQRTAMLSNPSTPPVITVNATSSQPYAAGTYTFVYTFFGPAGETAPSPEATYTLAAGASLIVTSGEAAPAGTTGMRTYVKAADGTFRLSGWQMSVPDDGSRPSVSLNMPPGIRNIPSGPSAAHSSPQSVSVSAVSAPGLLTPGAYYVKTTQIYRDGQSYYSPAKPITVYAGQAIKVKDWAFPADALGIYAYISAKSDTGYYLAGSSTGPEVVLTGDQSLPVPPTLNTTALPAPSAAPVTPSSLVTGPYHVAYTLTAQDYETAASPVTGVTIAAGQQLSVQIPALTSPATGANVYIGTDPASMRLAGKTTGTILLTQLPDIDQPPLPDSAVGDYTGEGLPPESPATGPDLTVQDGSVIPAGTYSIRYAYTDGDTETAPSDPRTVTLSAEEAVSVLVPPLPPGMSGAYVYMGQSPETPVEPSRRFETAITPGNPVVLAALPGGHEIGTADTGALGAPALSTAVGGTLTGDVYISYTLYDSQTQKESPRSASAYRNLASASALTVTPPALKGWNGFRVYVGKAPGEERLVQTVVGSQATVTSAVPSGVAVYSLRNSWSELDATWIRANQNSIWDERGGDVAKDGAAAGLGDQGGVSADLTSLVRSWVSGTLPNNGVMLKSTGGAFDFASSDYSAPTARPVLQITYRERQGPPVVTLTSPANGASLSGDVTLSAFVTTPDPGTAIQRVEFYANNALIGTDSQVPYNATWRTEGLPAGSYNLEARAYDTAGQMGSSAWTPVLEDSFQDGSNLNGSATTARTDYTAEMATLPMDAKAVAIEASTVTASTTKAAEAYPATNFTDTNSGTFWRSAGKPTPEASETVLLSLSSSSSTIYVTPHNAADGLVARLQVISATGDVSYDGPSYVLNGEKAISSPGGKGVRLVFTNLKPDLATGLYHAEIDRISTVTYSIVDAPAYEAVYDASLAFDDKRNTAWVSAGKPTPADAESLEFTLSADASVNTLHITPRTPGVSMTLYQVNGSVRTQLLSVASLQEGVYSLPGPIAPGSRLYAEFSNLMPAADGQFYAGIDELTAYESSLGSTSGTVQTNTITLPFAAKEFLLAVDDTAPMGTTISYDLFDGTQWHAIQPGLPLTLDSEVSAVTLRSKLDTKLPPAVPSLSAWRLFANSPAKITLEAAADTTPPTVSLVPLGTGALGETVTVNVNAWDNVGVTKVELYADQTRLDTDEEEPFIFQLHTEALMDTGKLTAGQHLLWAKAYDAVGHEGTSLQETETYTALSDLFGDTSKVNLALTSAGWDPTNQSFKSSVSPRHLLITKTGEISQRLQLNPGWVTVSAPTRQDASGVCVSGSVTLMVDNTTNFRTESQDMHTRGECDPLQLRYYNTRYNYAAWAYISQDAAGGEYTGEISYPGLLGSDANGTYDYGSLSQVFSQPVTVSAPIKSVKLTVDHSGQVRYYYSADGGATWTLATPGQDTPLSSSASSGNQLVLRADLFGTKSSGSTLFDVPAEVKSWVADVTTYPSGQLVTVSEVSGPGRLTGAAGGSQNSLGWENAAAVYHVYRGTQREPGGKDAVAGISYPGNAQTLPPPALVDGANLLKNSSFERGTVNWTLYASCIQQDTTQAWVNSSSLRLCLSGSNKVTQSVWPGGTASAYFASAMIKTENAVESTTNDGVGLTLNYGDGTSETAWSGIQGGTVDWTVRKVSLTPSKPVTSVQITLQSSSSGTVWVDAVELDKSGANSWNAGELNASQTYYYRVTNVDGTAESTASNDWCTCPQTTGTNNRLGVTSFWPYSTASVDGGTSYVNLTSGNLAFTSTDLVYPYSLLAMVFRRTYNSQGNAIKGALGYGWDHNFNWILTTEPATQNRTLKEGDGSTFTFTHIGDTDGGSYDSPPGARMKLVVQGDKTVTIASFENNFLYTFDEGGYLTSVREPNGTQLTMDYDAPTKAFNPADLRKLMNVTAQGPGLSPVTIDFGYNDLGHLASLTVPDTTSKISFKYDEEGNLARVIDLSGNATSYAYDADHRITGLTDANNATTGIYYDGVNAAVSVVTFADGTQESFSYGGAADKPEWTTTTVTDALRYAYKVQFETASGLMKKKTSRFAPASSNVPEVSFEHDGNWNVISYKDQRGYFYNVAYDGLGNITAVTDPLGNVTRNDWLSEDYPSATGQSLNLIEQTTDAMGNSTRYAYDGNGNLINVRTPLQELSYSYDEVRPGLRKTQTDANKNSTSFDYDSYGRVSQKTDPLGNVTQYAYDESGHPHLITDPMGNVTSYEYDAVGRLTGVSYPDGAKQTNLFDGAGNLVEMIDPVDGHTKYDYDSRGRVITRHEYPNPGDTTTEYVTKYEYNSVGQPIAVVDARGNRWTSNYDGNGRKVSTTNPLNLTTTFTYDDADNLLTVTNPRKHMVAYGYDALNRRISTTVPQDSTGRQIVVTATYDALGRKTSLKDGFDDTTEYFYDAVGRLTSVKDPLGAWTHYTYDGNGNTVAVVDTQRRVTQYVYDADNRQIEEHRPDGSVVSNTYDGAGRLVSRVNARGQTTSFSYDSRDRLLNIVYSDMRSVEFTYDLVGQRTSMTDWNGTTRYHYNQLGWLMETEDPWGHRVTYGYDADGNTQTVGLQFPGVDFDWEYTYDAANRATSVQSPEVITADTMTYDDTWDEDRLTFANGDSEKLDYDLANEVESITSSSAHHSALTSFTYAYDQAGRRTSVTRSGDGVIGAGTKYYGYDASSRMISVGTSSTVSDRDLYYDLMGNWIAVSAKTGDPTGVYAYVHDSSNRMMEEFGPVPSTEGGGRYHKSYSYDADGNLTRSDKDGRDIALYSYDEDSRLISVTNELGQVTTNTYDGDGKRVRTDDIHGTTVFIYGGDEVLAEVDAAGALQVAYTRLPGGRLISQWQKGETYWYHLDGLNSTVVITDKAGQIRNVYGYDEFGNATPGTSERVWNRYTFTGQAWDFSAGVYNYKARYYNPQIGRFLTQDTYKGNPWEPWTQNLYVYVGNNPVNYVDPTGHRADDAAGGGGGLMLLWNTFERMMELGDDIIWKMSDSVGQRIQTVAQGLWKLGPALRGRAAEEVIGGATEGYFGPGNNFPTIDAYSKGVATSIKSMDLSAKSYQTQQGISRTITKMVDTLRDFSGNVRVGNNEAGEVTKRVLNVAIPSMELSDVQRQGLYDASQYAMRQGVELIITVLKEAPVE